MFMDGWDVELVGTDSEFAPMWFEFARKPFELQHWGAVGLCYLRHVEGRIVRIRIVVREPGNYNIFGTLYPWFPCYDTLYEIFSHELGHGLGFWGHTEDGGLMDSHLNDSTEITDTVRTMLATLYSLAPGQPLVPMPVVPIYEEVVTE